MLNNECLSCAGHLGYDGELFFFRLDCGVSCSRREITAIGCSLFATFLDLAHVGHLFVRLGPRTVFDTVVDGASLAVVIC